MPHDPEAFADMVVLTIKSALTPVLERLAVAEQCNRDLQARVQDLASLRDRVVVAETKAAAVPQPPDLGDVRDRLLVLETKAETPPPVVNVASSAPPVSPEDVSSLRDRLIAADRDVAALHKQVAALEQTVDKDSSRLEGYSSALQRDLAAVSERVAVVEVRAQMPGPAGKDGKDGADGFSADELSAVQDGDRTLVLKMARGDRVKEIGRLSLPVMIQRGVYIDGKLYEPGDVTTWGGSQWHCNEPTTTKPGEGSKSWTLIVKRGRDGKDGRDGRDPVPVVKVS